MFGNWGERTLTPIDPCFLSVLPTCLLLFALSGDRTFADASISDRPVAPNGSSPTSASDRVELSELKIHVNTDPAPFLSQTRSIGIVTDLTNRSHQAADVSALDISERVRLLLAKALGQPSADTEFERRDVQVRVLTGRRIVKPGDQTAFVLKCVIEDIEVPVASPVSLLSCAGFADDIELNGIVMSGWIRRGVGTFSVFGTTQPDSLVSGLDDVLAPWTSGVASVIRQYPSAALTDGFAAWSIGDVDMFSPALFADVTEATVVVYASYQTGKSGRHLGLPRIAAQTLGAAMAAPAIGRERPRIDVEFTDQGWRGSSRLQADISVTVRDHRSAYGNLTLFSCVLRYEVRRKQGNMNQSYFFLTEPVVFIVPDDNSEYEEMIRRTFEQLLRTPATLMRQSKRNEAGSGLVVAETAVAASVWRC